MDRTIGIQWKGTDTCLDLTCPDCDTFTHFCPRMPFCGAVKCPGCSKVWYLEHRVRLREPDEDDAWRAYYAERDSAHQQ